MKKQYKLRTKLVLSFMSIIIVMALLFMGLSVRFLSSAFDDHGRNNQVLVIETLAQSMYNNKGRIDTLTQQQVRWMASLYNVDVQIYDRDKQLIYDLPGHHFGKSKIVRHKREDDDDEPEHSETYALTVNDEIVGYAQFGSEEEGYFGNQYLKNSLVRGTRVIVAGSFIVTLILGLYMAYRVSKPLQSVTVTAHDLSAGNLESRSKIRSSTKEITELCAAINHLGHTLQDQEYLRKRLTADVSHELRTPLNILRNQIEALLDGIFSPDEKRLKILLSEVDRLTHMVNDLEKLTALDQNHQKIHTTSINLKQLLLEVLDPMESEIIKKELEIELDLEDIQYQGDYSKLKQVFINLFNNALKFTPDKGSIHVLMVRKTSFIELNIIDSGIGIPNKDLDFIFERFYRAENSRNRKTGGAGLGLAIVKEIVEAHKGTITIKNNENEGITVNIQLPI